MGAVLRQTSLHGLSIAANSVNASGYKAIVNVPLFGGCDMANVRVPIDPSGYAGYASLRGALALPQASLIPLANTNYGLHPSMPNLATLFNAGKAAFVANQGPLIQPVTIQEARQELLLPSNLMSHSDQQNLIQTLGTSTSQPDGAGGHIADLMSDLGPTNLPLATSVTGGPLTFLEGKTNAAFIAPSNGLVLSCAQNTNCQTAKLILGIPSTSTLVEREELLQQQMYQYQQVYADAIQGAFSFQTPLPANNGLAYQFHQVATMMSVRNSLGCSRQIFSAVLGGFDTHAAQLPTQAGLLAVVDSALGYFWSALGEIGMRNSVVVILTTEFGRQWVPGPNGGSDHAFGNDLFLVGGPLIGGQIYGRNAVLEVGGPDDFTGDGRSLPSTSTSSIYAELALWFGASPAQLAYIVPEFANFPGSILGFLGQVNPALAPRLHQKAAL
jgi:uncharacterized protein (DUF1501 family)